MIGYTYIVLAEMAIALIGFGVWVHHMFATGLPTIGLGFISLTSFLVVIPSGVQIFAWLATLWAGKPILKTPMLFVLGFIILFVIGGLTGPMLAAIPLDQQVTDSYFVVAHFHYVLVGGAMFPIFAGIYFWVPKMTGRLLHEGWGKVSFWLMFIGFNALFFPMHILGLRGMPRRTYTYQPGHGWDALNLLETIGAFVLALGILITFVNWMWSTKRGKPAGHDPWRGETLEWATTSPPAEYNFENIPTVHSREPMWDQPELGPHGQPPEAGGRGLGGGHNTLCTSLLEAEPEVVVPMPHESPWPLLLTIALFGIFLGLVIRSLLFATVFGFASVVSVAGWLWPRNQTQET
jgi:cytochrome c oxidase subunit 1/cytochrome c oxidase subunit I+III